MKTGSGDVGNGFLDIISCKSPNTGLLSPFVFGKNSLHRGSTASQSRFLTLALPSRLDAWLPDLASSQAEPWPGLLHVHVTGGGKRIISLQ